MSYAIDARVALPLAVAARASMAYMGAYGPCTGDVIECSDAEMGLALGFEMASQIRQGYWDATNRVKVHTGEGGQMYSTTNLKPS